MPRISGTIYRYGSKERAGNSIIKATPQQGNPVYAVADDDGDFDFAGLSPDTWTLVALHEDHFPSRPRTFDLMQDDIGLRIDLFRLQGNEDKQKGRNFFILLLVALGALIILYMILHLTYPRVREPLSLALAATIKQAEAELTSQSDKLPATIADVKRDLETVVTQTADLNAADQEILRNTVAEIEEAIQADRKEEALTGLMSLRRLVELPLSSGFALWDRYPWRFLEVLLWGLAGILVCKIITIGSYLRWQQFYREGIVMHVAHIVTVPLLTLVAALLLSLATLSITLTSGNELTLDLSEPRILAAVSFLLGTSPWPLWGFIEDKAKRLLGKGD